MLATLSKLSLIDPTLPTGIIGKSFAEVQSLDWFQNWNSANLMFISDFNGNGTLELNEFFMGGKAVVLATPEIAGLPYVISGLVAAGGMAAAMSTADGLILAIANAISHDVYYKMIDPKAETAKGLLVASVLLVVIGYAAAAIAALQIQAILYSVILRTDGSGCLGLTQLTFGIFGAAVSVVAMVVVSLMTSAPEAATSINEKECKIKRQDSKEESGNK